MNPLSKLITINTGLISIGAPLPPGLVSSVVNVSTISVDWDTPFTFPEFPIVNYTVQVTNQTSGELLDSAVLAAEDVLSYNITRTGPPPSCSNLVFSVVASNDIGPSMPATLLESFLVCEPQRFVESPRHEVAFTQGLTPLLRLSFMVSYNTVEPLNSGHTWNPAFL